MGDVDGDGELEVAFGTSAGGVHALRGPSGLDAPGFPFRTRGRIMAPVLLAPLVAGERRWWRPGAGGPAPGRAVARRAPVRDQRRVRRAAKVPARARSSAREGRLWSLRAARHASRRSMHLKHRVNRDSLRALPAARTQRSHALLARRTSRACTGAQRTRLRRQALAGMRTRLRRGHAWHVTWVYGMSLALTYTLSSIAARRFAPGCADTVDVGETAYAAVLADDLDGDGRTELVLATMNGVLFCFQAAASRFQPLHAWPAQARARAPAAPRRRRWPPPPRAPARLPETLQARAARARAPGLPPPHIRPRWAHAGVPEPACPARAYGSRVGRPLPPCSC